MRELNKMLGIETKLSIVYHLQMDRQTEETNQELEQYLRMYVLWQPLMTKTNDHTSSKSLSGISSGEFTRELDKEPLLN